MEKINGAEGQLINHSEKLNLNVYFSNRLTEGAPGWHSRKSLWLSISGPKFEPHAGCRDYLKIQSFKKQQQKTWNPVWWFPREAE